MLIYTCYQGNEATKVKRLAYFSLPFATFFWGWACFNSYVKPSIDLGVFSFLTVMLSSVYLIRRKLDETLMTEAERNLIVFTYSLVTINYAGGMIIGFIVGMGMGFIAYCLIFTLLWAFMATMMYRWIGFLM